jgi:CRP/FNR family transcriptional regulator, polysaccharide utilization system transcription regulator
MNKQKLCEGCDKCNLKSPLFQVLSEEELGIINKDRYSIRFNKGEMILKQGTSATTLISVVEGFARKYVEGFNDRNLILDFVKPWQLVGAPGVHNTGKHSYSVVAISETLVCFLDVENFNEVLGINNDFAKLYIKLCSKNYGRSLDRMVSLSQKQMPGRVADALIYLSDEIYNSSCIGTEITRQDIADYTSMSKDSAIRILKEFERDSIIELDGRCIEVLDMTRLHSISLMG